MHDLYSNPYYKMKVLRFFDTTITTTNNNNDHCYFVQDYRTPMKTQRRYIIFVSRLS
jgi:hypothetical protein